MRLKASHRRRLQELLSIAGSPEIAVVLPWVQHWRAVGATELLDFLGRSTSQPVAAAVEAAAKVKVEQADTALADARDAADTAERDLLAAQTRMTKAGAKVDALRELQKSPPNP